MTSRDPGSEAVEALLAACCNGHLRSGRMQHPGEPLAEAGRGPGDDGNLAVESEEGERVNGHCAGHDGEARAGDPAGRNVAT